MADDVIARMIRQSSAPRRLTIVSSDRAILREARRRRCRTITSDQFLAQLARDAERRADAPSPIPAALRSLWNYHAQAWNFHVGLTGDHSYQSNPLSWFVQTRPTSFYWSSLERGESGCEADSCAAEVLALGNPVIRTPNPRSLKP